jgi:hypothetical protein
MYTFLASLACDLRATGWRADARLSATVLAFTASRDAGRKTSIEPPGAVVSRRSAERPALLGRVSRLGLRSKFHPGADFSPLLIRPRIVVCNSRAEHDLFSFAQLQQSVPSAPRPGRRIRFLVMDEGQSTQALIGVMELASPIFRLACRDDALGWGGGDSGLRRAGLCRTMDLSVCLAMPAYRRVRAGKLLALLAASDFAGETFGERYGEPLCAIIATCATGLHYPQLNRLTVRPGGLYRRIGATAGYSTSGFSKETLGAARDLLTGEPAAAFGPGHQKGLRLLRTALRRARLDPEPLLRSGRQKGVYLCDAPGDGIEALRSGGDPNGAALEAGDCLRWWRRRVLVPLLEREDPDLGPSILAPVDAT